MKINNMNLENSSKEKKSNIQNFGELDKEIQTC